METIVFEGASCDWTDLPCHLSSFADWLWYALTAIPKFIWQTMLEGMAIVINALPLPVEQPSVYVAGAFASVGPSLIWWTDLIALKEGFLFMSAGLMARFLLRRIPLIG